MLLSSPSITLRAPWTFWITFHLCQSSYTPPFPPHLHLPAAIPSRHSPSRAETHRKGGPSPGNFFAKGVFEGPRRKSFQSPIANILWLKMCFAQRLKIQPCLSRRRRGTWKLSSKLYDHLFFSRIRRRGFRSFFEMSPIVVPTLSDYLLVDRTFSILITYQRSRLLRQLLCTVCATGIRSKVVP